jgi:hypothetical protein
MIGSAAKTMPTGNSSAGRSSARLRVVRAGARVDRVRKVTAVEREALRSTGDALCEVRLASDNLCLRTRQPASDETRGRHSASRRTEGPESDAPLEHRCRRRQEGFARRRDSDNSRTFDTAGRSTATASAFARSQLRRRRAPRPYSTFQAPTSNSSPLRFGCDVRCSSLWASSDRSAFVHGCDAMAE